MLAVAAPRYRGPTIGLYSCIGFGAGFLGTLLFGVTLDQFGGTSQLAAWALSFGTCGLACLAMVVPLASGQDGFLGAVVFGIAGMQAAYDLVGVVGVAQRSTSLLHGAQREGVQALRLAADEQRSLMAIQVARELSSSSRGQYGHQ